MIAGSGGGGNEVGGAAGGGSFGSAVFRLRGGARGAERGVGEVVEGAEVPEETRADGSVLAVSGSKRGGLRGRVRCSEVGARGAGQEVAW